VSIRPSPADLAGVGLAALLSVAMVLLVYVQDDGTVFAAFVALAMTVPVAYARAAPVAAGLSLGVAAVLNEVLFGHLVRCGAGLPATFYVAVVIGYVLGRRGRLALAGVMVSIVVQCIWDPRLGAAVIVLMAPIALVFFGAGLYLRRRAAMSDALREYADRLQEQREQTALIAVAADREVLVSQLTATLTRQIGAIEAVALSSANDRAAFAVVERLGRETLDEMRALFNSLHESPTSPEPGIADLAEVCTRATAAEVHLTVDGEVRALPASIELSACRIVEQLLRLLTDRPQARVQLTLDYALSGLDIALSGASQGGADLQQIEAVASTRAALHGGRIEINERGSECHARVWLPLVPAHV
jgi:hypothetical protein